MAGRLAGGDHEAARFQAADVRQYFFRPLRGDQRDSVPPKGTPFRPRQSDAPTNPVEQLYVVALFQCTDRRADGGLGQVELTGSTSDMLDFGDGDENPQLLQSHL